MMNNTLHALPVPDIIEPSLNHSFKVSKFEKFRRFALFTQKFCIIFLV